MQTYRDVVANRQGVPVPGASILVKTAAGALASLFDTNGASIANPITSVDGSFAFAAANGDYVLNIASFGGVVVVDGIQMYDPADDSPLTQAQAAASSGASKIGYGQRTIENKLGEFVSVKDAPFNAKGDGATDDTAAIQAAINEVKVTGARLEIPPGIYVVSGDGLAANGPFSLHGASMDQVWLKNANGSVLRIQGNGCSIDGISLWSQGGGHTVVQTGSLSQSNWTHYRIRQDAADYSGWDNAGFEYVDNRHSHFDYVHAQGSSKAFFNLVAAGGLINDNEWRAGRTNNSGIHFFRIRSTSANWQYANKFDKITFEVCKGGGIDLQGAMLFEINDCQNWDCGANSITNHFYSIQLNANSIGSVGRIRSCGRWAGGNTAGIYDVQLPAGGGGAGINIEDCTTSGGGDSFTVDCANNGVTVRIPVDNLMSLINAGSATIIRPTGIQFPGSSASLSKYDEGTWTPAIGSAGTFTYTNQLGKWTRVGRQVTVQGYLSIATVSGASGTVVVTGLPFSIPNALANYGVVQIAADVLTAGATGQITGFGNINGSSIVVQMFSAGVLSDISTYLKAGTTFRFTYTYFAS